MEKREKRKEVKPFLDVKRKKHRRKGRTEQAETKQKGKKKGKKKMKMGGRNLGGKEGTCEQKDMKGKTKLGREETIFIWGLSFHLSPSMRK